MTRLLRALVLLAACAPRGERPAHDRRPSNGAPATAAAATASTIVANDNLRPAGRLEAGVLAVRLEARNGLWYPEGPSGPGLPVAAFAEAGRPMENPGPLIRVPAGTEVRLTLRNGLAKRLTVMGLGWRRGPGEDSLRLEPGAEREVRFRASTPGTWYYAGATTPAPVLGRSTEDSQLNGAIVVDPAVETGPGAAAGAERIFVVSWWFTLDSTSASGLGRATLAINGRSWPHTGVIDAAQGDSLHWRWINLTGLDHPMHLHGFYFRVDGAGDGARWADYQPSRRRLAVTEVLPPGGTMALAWSPDRAGNWIMHCHFVGHISHHVSLSTVNGVPAAVPGTGVMLASARHGTGAGGHRVDGGTTHQMAGLVLGIRVRPHGPAPVAAAAARPIRLVVRSAPNQDGRHPRYAYALGGTPAASDGAPLPRRSPTLVLRRGEPVAVTVVNRSESPAAVHWHGIELESAADGVPGWSGSGRRVMRGIAPGDSMVVRFTPPRAGTFMYHSHFDELDQIASGQYGAIVVLEGDQAYRPETDRVLLFSDDGPTENIIRGPFAAALLNGERRPGPIELEAGTTYRLRLINIRTDYKVALTLRERGKPATWRVVAKDGASLPAEQVADGPAALTFAAGEIYDVEYTPRAPGRLTLRYQVPPGGPVREPPTEVAVRVR